MDIGKYGSGSIRLMARKHISVPLALKEPNRCPSKDPEALANTSKINEENVSAKHPCRRKCSAEKPRQKPVRLGVLK
jgi:hypothetical protein